MQPRNLILAALAAGAVVASVPLAQAAMTPPPGAVYATPDIFLTAGGCGPGSHRLLFGGGCSVRPYNKTQSEYLNDLRPCQPGTHSVSAPNLQGYRCVLNGY
jgi:hypothetical protein